MLESRFSHSLLVALLMTTGGCAMFKVNAPPAPPADTNLAQSYSRADVPRDHPYKPDLSEDGFIRITSKLPCLTGKLTPVTGWRPPAGAPNDAALLTVKGLGKWQDPTFWHLKGDKLYFRAKRPGPQQPEFAAHAHGKTLLYRFHCNVRTTALKIDFDWDHLKKVGTEIRTPFKIELPRGFEPPFRVRVKPKKVVHIEKVPQKRRRRRCLIEGYIVCREIRAFTRKLLIDLKDSTDAVARVSLDVPDECEFLNPPKPIQRIAKKFRNSDELLEESRRILTAVNKLVLLDTDDGKDTTALFEWIGKRRKCHSISDRARRFFQDQAALYRMILGGRDLKPYQVERLLNVLDQLGSSDIKNEFLEGYYGK